MSNLYVTEPAPNGKVIFDTTGGEIEVELWGKECPKTVRNFLQLSMEGYYDGIIFHRLVKDFIIQSGDPTGTGTGGDSIYGEPFEDEIHGRLKFNRRGLLGMANRSKRNTNTSQFFFTLDRADELTGKHTMFGRIQGNTLYNMGQLDVDEEERPKRPPKIKGIRIIENPFPDIVPRITAAERRAQQQAKLDARKDLEQREKRSKAKKNTALLSFGEAEEIPDDPSMKKKGLERADLVEPVQPAPKKAAQTFVDVPDSLKDLGSADKPKKNVDLKAIREQHEREKAGGEAARQAEIKRMQEDLRKLKKRTGEDSESESDDDVKRKRRVGPSYLEQELAKYSKGRGRAAKAGNKRGRRDEEDDLLAEMSKFSRKVSEIPNDDDGDNDRGGAADEEGLDVDNDVGWMKHKLKFEVDEKELTRRAEEEYAVIDPRAKAREVADEERRGPSASKGSSRSSESRRR